MSSAPPSKPEQDVLSDTQRPLAEPAPPLPSDEADRRLALLLWDAPSIDVTLHELAALNGSGVTRPNFRAVATWLCDQAAPDSIVEALAFVAVPDGRGKLVLPFVQAIRQAGFTVFVWPRSSGDIDVAFSAAAETRITHGRPPGVVVLATHDQKLAGPVGDAAQRAGWRVVQLGLRENSSWVGLHTGWEAVDLEDVPSAFGQPLIRLDLDHLPSSGRWLPPAARLRPGQPPGTPDAVIDALRQYLERVVKPGAPVDLSRLVREVPQAFSGKSPRIRPLGNLDQLVAAALAGHPTLSLLDAGTPSARVSSSPTGASRSVADE